MSTVCTATFTACRTFMRAARGQCLRKKQPARSLAHDRARYALNLSRFQVGLGAGRQRPSCLSSSSIAKAFMRDCSSFAEALSN